MAYEKKDNYPLIKKPGIYPEKTIKELGLDNDNLEKFSLGHWKSIHRSNRTFVNRNQINTFSETVDEIEEEDTLEIRLVSPFNPSTDGGERLTAYRFFMQVYVESPNGTIAIANSGDGTFNLEFPVFTSYADFVSDNQGNDKSSQGNQPNYYNNSLNEQAITNKNNVHIPDGNDYQNVLQFMRDKQQDLYDFLKGAPVFIEQNTLSDENKILYGLSPFVVVGDLDDGAGVTTTPTNPLKFSFTQSRQLELDTILNEFIEVPIQLYTNNNDKIDLTEQDDIESVTMRLSIMFGRPTEFFDGTDLSSVPFFQDEATTNFERPYIVPRFDLAGAGIAHESDFFAANIVSRPDAEEMYAEIEEGSTDPGEFIYKRPLIAIYDRDQSGFYQAIIPNLLQTDFSQDSSPHDSTDGVARKAYWENNLGWPNFNPEDLTEYEEYLGEEALELQLQQFRVGLDIAYTGFMRDYTPEIPDVDYAVSCFYSKPSRNDDKIERQEFLQNHQDEHFLYYDFTENPQEYEATSYPIKLNLIVDLLDSPNFINEIRLTSIERYRPILEDPVEYNVIEDDITEGARKPQECVYRYEVISWGDEKTPIDDEKIKNSFYFNVYDSEEFPDIDSYENKKRISSQTNLSKLIIEREEIEGEADSRLYNISSHTYTTPGLKAIKLIIYRYTPNGLFLLSSTLITKNININDGLLKAQDFSILGGTDFKFLPLKNNDAIIGGLDKDSDYNNSVEKIKKDDNFVKEDYLERASSRDFIDNFNNKLHGESSGQLDLSLTRVFNKPFDIYDFIKGNRALIAENEFNLNDINLPVNSQATDIFINNNNCIIDINPNEIEFSSIQNKVGVGDKAILIGDYKINQPKDSRVQKEGTMKTPLIENDIDKQAF